MPNSDFKPFATGVGAVVESNVDWAALPDLVNGFPSGVLPSKKLNKALRQANIIAAVVAQFIADGSGVDSIDDGTTATLLANMKRSIGKLPSIEHKHMSISAPPANSVQILSCAPFVAPCNGTVHAWSTANWTDVGASALTVTLLVNGNLVSAADSKMPQSHFGEFSVTGGTSVTVSTRVNSTPVASGIYGSLRVGAFFTPS